MSPVEPISPDHRAHPYGQPSWETPPPKELHYPMHGPSYDPAKESLQDYIGRILDWVVSDAHRNFFRNGNYKAALNHYKKYFQYRSFYGDKFPELFTNFRANRYYMGWTQFIVGRLNSAQKTYNQELRQLLEDVKQSSPTVRGEVLDMQRYNQLPSARNPRLAPKLEALDQIYHAIMSDPHVEEGQRNLLSVNYLSQGLLREARRQRGRINRSVDSPQIWQNLQQAREQAVLNLIEMGLIPWSMPYKKPYRHNTPTERKDPKVPGYPYYYVDNVRYDVGNPHYQV